MIESPDMVPPLAPWLEGQPELPKADMPLGARSDRGRREKRMPTPTPPPRFDWSELWEKVWPARWLRK